LSFSLLPTPSGSLSVEFEPQDHAALKAAVEDIFGALQVTWSATLAEVKFGGEAFTYADEWDHPCLIASTPRGNTMLQALHARLTADGGEFGRR